MRIKIAQLQTKVFPEKGKNLEQLEILLNEIKEERPDLVTVGEMVTCPYETSNFPVYAEKQGGESWQAFSRLMSLTVREGRLPRTERFISLI